MQLARRSHVTCYSAIKYKEPLSTVPSPYNPEAFHQYLVTNASDCSRKGPPLSWGAQCHQRDAASPADSSPTTLNALQPRVKHTMYTLAPTQCQCFPQLATERIGSSQACQMLCVLHQPACNILHHTAEPKSLVAAGQHSTLWSLLSGKAHAFCSRSGWTLSAGTWQLDRWNTMHACHPRPFHSSLCSV
jgi:hypothetical protein